MYAYLQSHLFFQIFKMEVGPSYQENGPTYPPEEGNSLKGQRPNQLSLSYSLDLQKRSLLFRGAWEVMIE